MGIGNENCMVVVGGVRGQITGMPFIWSLLESCDGIFGVGIGNENCMDVT